MKADQKKLLNIIKYYVKPRSIIYTNLWCGYSRLENDEEFNYAHRTVNHSKYLKNPMTGVHINTIEGLWSKSKTYILPKKE